MWDSCVRRALPCGWYPVGHTDERRSGLQRLPRAARMAET